MPPMRNPAMYSPATPPQSPFIVRSPHPNLTMIVLIATYASIVFTGRLTGKRISRQYPNAPKAAPPREANTPAFPLHSFFTSLSKRKSITRFVTNSTSG